MTMNTKLARTTLGIIGPMVAMAAGGGTATAAAANQPQQVLVVNASAQAVPTVAQGTTAVSGAVSVLNTVTAHLDSNVVVVDNSQPLVTRDADGGTPVSATVAFQLAIGTVGFGGRYVVPDNKRLIVEYVSGRVTGGDGSQHERATIEWGGGHGGRFQRHFLVPSAIASDDRLYAAPIRMYFGPGEDVDIRVERDSADTELTAEFNLSGRLVDIQ